MCYGRMQAYKAGWTAALCVCLTDRSQLQAKGMEPKLQAVQG